MKALGEAANELPWVMPDITSLIALTKPEPDWQLISRDPGAVLLVLRAEGSGVRGQESGVRSQTRKPEAPSPDRIGYSTDPPNPKTSTVCGQASVLQTALTIMSRSHNRPIAWNKPGCDVIYRHCLDNAALAQTLAASLPRCDGERAWIAGLLAPLGWLAVCAVDPERIRQQLRAFQRSGDPTGWQHQAWGLDHAALVRRLSRAWCLPSWLTAVIGHLGLPVEIAARLGADPMLFQVVQLAVGLRQRDEAGLALPVGAPVEELISSLDLSDAELESILQTSREHAAQASDVPMWKAPKKKRLLMDILQLALDARYAAGSVSLAGAACSEPLACASRSEEERLQVQKMAALAELAAGAGHEINNPLAVISGQAQYIARQLEQAKALVPEEPALEKYLETLQAGIQRSLHAIRGQSQRIHNVLTDLMQFARPRPPQPRTVAVQELLRETAAAIQDLAELRKTRLVCQDVPDGWHVRIDPAQTRAALSCLLRNAVEAAPPDGWAGLRAETTGDNRLLLLVEDNGPGPSPQAQEHMFDPFYSGRAAGRGQGLGLPIAWRLARQQGGDVSFDGHADGVTRFILGLPGLETGHAVADRNGQAAPMKQPA